MSASYLEAAPRLKGTITVVGPGGAILRGHGSGEEDGDFVRTGLFGYYKGDPTAQGRTVAILKHTFRD